MSKPENRFDLARAASAILKRAGFDAVSGAKKDKKYRRHKRAEDKVAGRRFRARQKVLGKFGPASPTRLIEPATRAEKDLIG